MNPEQGKGANRPKADALTIGGQDSFWLLEYFKYAGLYQAAVPRIVQGRKDRKTYVVIPARDGVSWRWHRDVFAQFQNDLWASSAIKMDIQAILRFTSTMLQQWEAAQSSGGRKRRPSDYIDGFMVASYKDLGSAVAVMNVSTLRLPDWVDWPETQEQASDIRKVVEEHRLLTAVLDEKKSEEEQLLRRLSRFPVQPRSRSFGLLQLHVWLCRTQYARLAKRQPVRRLSTDNLGVIIMANDERREASGSRKLGPILETPGFRSIATAIRQSTVTQQYYKSKFDDNTYEIRYGLADDLRRKSRESHEFVRAISDFVQQYSQENARIRERFHDKGYRKRRLVSTDDIAQLIELVDTYGASTIASLLVAYRVFI